MLRRYHRLLLLSLHLMLCWGRRLALRLKLHVPRAPRHHALLVRVLVLLVLGVRLVVLGARVLDRMLGLWRVLLLHSVVRHVVLSRVLLGRMLLHLLLLQLLLCCRDHALVLRVLVAVRLRTWLRRQRLVCRLLAVVHGLLAEVLRLRSVHCPVLVVVVGCR